MSTRVRGWPVALVTGAFLLLVPRSPAGEPKEAPMPTVRIGVAESLCRDTDPKVLMALSPPFRTLARSCTGLDCDLSYGGNAFHLADCLARGQLDLAIFQGIEFAWVRQKHPGLRPLLMVVNGKPYQRAYLVVPTCGRVTGLANLAGRPLAISRYSLEDCYQFLGKLCREQGLSQQRLLAQLIQPADAEEALDGIVDGTIGAAIVEEVSLDCYQRRKPGRFERLKIVQGSERFPATVVAYRAGGLTEETLRLFREGMLRAPKAPANRHLLTWWRISGFETVPASYPEALAEITKAYPTPPEDSQAPIWRSVLGQADRLLGPKWSSFLSGP